MHYLCPCRRFFGLALALPGALPGAPPCSCPAIRSIMRMTIRVVLYRRSCLVANMHLWSCSDIHYRKKSFYNGDDELPVYRWNGSKEHYSLDSLADVLLTDSVPPSSICSKQPVHVCHNVSFVVDLHKLDDPVDVRADEKWCLDAARFTCCLYVSKHMKDGKTRFFRRTKKPMQPHQFNITRTYYRHGSSPNFTRMIVVAHGEWYCGVYVHTCMYM